MLLSHSKWPQQPYEIHTQKYSHNTLFYLKIYNFRFLQGTSDPFSTSWYDSFLWSSWKVCTYFGSNFSMVKTPFLPGQKQLCSQRPVSAHVQNENNNDITCPESSRFEHVVQSSRVSTEGYWIRWEHTVFAVIHHQSVFSNLHNSLFHTWSKCLRGAFSFKFISMVCSFIYMTILWIVKTKWCDTL